MPFGGVFLVLNINELVMEYGIQKLFEVNRLTVDNGERIGIVGENGAGKTTLLDIVASKIKPTMGSVQTNGCIGYISQRIVDIPDAQLSYNAYQWCLSDNPMSGGEKTRAKIAEAFSQKCDLLLCDEPTTNLDEKGIILLEKELKGFEGAMLLVSHDRMLLDKVCTRIWEISDGKIHTYSGNYSEYRAQKETQIRNKKKAYEKYIREKRNLERAIREQTAKANGMTHTPARMGNSEARLHRMDVRQRSGKVSGGTQSMKSRLEQLEVKEKVKGTTQYHLSITDSNIKASKIVVEARALHFAYEDIQVLSDVSFQVYRGERVCIVGDNGSGKSTLLNCIVNHIEGVRVSESDSVGYFAQNSLDLDEHAKILAYILKNTNQSEMYVRNILAAFGIRRGQVYKQIEVLSGGEKSKVALATLLCRRCTLLILDEPTNYLDIHMMEALEQMLLDYDGTILFVSHDRQFREKLAGRTLCLKDRRLNEKYFVSKETKRNRKASRILLEMKAETVLGKMQGVSDEQHEELDKEYCSLMAEIKRLDRL